MRHSHIPYDKEESLIVMLCKMSFLAPEVKSNIFQFCYIEDQYRRYSAIARKYIHNTNIEGKRYKIHRTFHTELMIEKS